MVAAKTSDRTFFCVCIALFVATSAVTVVWCTATPAAAHACVHPAHSSGKPTADAHWASAAASFLAMWIVMMVAMMLPSLVPMLLRYREAVGRSAGRRLGRLTALVGVGYFSFWAAVGLVLYSSAAVWSTVERAQPALAQSLPAGGIVVLAAGLFQFTAWKERHVGRCRETSARERTFPADGIRACSHGVRLGLVCSCSCANLMILLLVFGSMDLGAMAAVTLAITLERVAPIGTRIAHATGLVVVAAGLLLTARAAGLA
jgi:predicted metal-binding membrane protein